MKKVSTLKEGGGGEREMFYHGKLLVYFFSRFHKTKTRTFKKNLRHSSLHPDLNSMFVKF